MSLAAGDRVGEWVVEGPLNPDAPDGAWIAHGDEGPWRRVQLRPLAGDPADVAGRVEALTTLEHPHLERLVGVAEGDGTWFVVSERRHGTALSAVWPSETSSRRLALSVSLAVTQALWFAHQHGVAHGDVSTDHVWLSEDGRLRLTGWFRNAAATIPGDRAAVAELLHELFATSRPVLAPVDDWVGKARQDPAKVSLAELRRSLTQLHAEFSGAVTPSSTPQRADTTFFDTDEPSPPSSRTPHQIGRYVVVREIGRGGAGVVYEAVDPDLQRHVAIKVLLAGDFARARDQQRFLNEARAVAQLDHRNIVKVLEFDRYEGRAWYAMELVDGPNLLQVIRDQGRLPWRAAVRLAASLARALQHAHDQGLVHRDVKPNNVLLEADQEPRLTDFGLALFTDDATQSRLTRTGQVLGTPSYMSPEQANGELHLIGPGTDVYGVGVVLYEALTGRVPFEGERPLSIIAAVVEGRVTPPRQIASSIPRQVEHTCLKAMQVDVGDRYATAADLAEDLERCLRGEPILATPPTLLDQARWFVRRNRAQLGIVATAVGIAMLILAASTAVLGARSVRRTNLAEAEAEAALTSVKTRIEELEADAQDEEADESWLEFARQPGHQGTRALVEGWWWRADHLAASGDREGQTSALAMAYAAAERSSDQQRALLRLADQARRSGALDRLPRIVATLDSRSPRVDRSPELQALRRDARTSERRLAEAAALADGPARAALQTLAGATPTQHVASRAVPWMGPDGGLVLWDEGSAPFLVGRGPELPLERRFADLDWGANQVVVPTSRRGTYWIGEGGAAVLTEIREDRPQRLRRYLGGPLRAATLAPDASGASFTPLLALGERLVEPTASGGGLRDLHLATSGARSVINDVVVADLDGRDAPEIVTALGEWNAYDVRIFDRSSGPARLLARRKLGVVTDLAVLPRPGGASSLLANKVDRAPNPELFGVQQPFGAPEGVWQLGLQLDERGAPTAELAATRIAPRPCDRLTIGDVDGDGDADVVGQCGPDLGLWVQESERLVGLFVRDLTVLALTNLDDDPQSELVVADERAGRRVWVLGVGRDVIPPIRTDAWAVAPPPGRAGEGFRESWQRAEELAFIGQLGQAAEAMQQLAELNWGEPLGWAATLRAATMHDLAGRPVRAGDLALRAADALEGLEQVAALRSASRAWRDAREAERELEVLEKLRDLGALDRGDVVRLRQLQERADRPTLSHDVLRPLDEGWHVDQPLSVRHEPGRGLVVEAFGSQTLAHVPVRWDGESLQLDVTFAVDSIERDGGIQVGIVAAGTEAPFYGIEVLGEAGTNGVAPVLGCRAGGSVQRTTFPEGEARTARFELFGGERGFGCSFAGTDGFRTASDRTAPIMGLGAWDLVIRATGASDTLARARLEHIEIVGASPDPGASAGDAARLAFANRRTGEALALLESGAPDELLRVAIAAARADGEALAAAFDSPHDLPRDQVLTHLLHCRLDTLTPDLQRLLGEDEFPWWFAQAWHSALARTTPDRALAEALLGSLDGIEDDQLETPEDRAAWVRLGARRASAALAVDDEERAQLAIGATLRWFDELRTIDRASRQVAGLRETVAVLHLDRAALALRRDEPVDEALEAVDRALRWAPDSLSLLDRALARDDLAALKGEPLMNQWQGALRIVPGR